ncbi:MFS transporter [Massilia sp. S19_KUP03_FR1]|uniref:MFS transporter n=1 Tax=Massilia sp. S19_KUP03_FR1 TaxID=3025503 RepID=UPI002FCCFFF6
MQATSVTPDLVPVAPISPGAADFKRINRAMMFGGFSTFALLYCIQPLMPMLSHEFALTAAQSSLALSLSTGMLAVSLIVSSLLSERVGRKPMMAASMTLGAILTVLCAFAQTYPQLLVLRGLLGFMLGGMPAIAMAYLSEEIDPRALGLSMGLYISGSAFGGMLGRMATSLISDFYNWRPALGLIGAAGLYAAWEFWRSLPASKNFRPGSRGIAGLVRGARGHFTDAGLPWLFVLAFLLMGAFVSLYNYIGYRMLGAPFALRPGVVGLLSLLYLLGIFSSVWAGRLADRLGRRNVLWLVMGAMLGGLLLTLINFLPTIVLGMGLFTFGFFASHSVASSWVGRRARAPQALASALYLFFYYLGSSVVGWVAGVAWEWRNWPGVVLVLGGALGLALLIALKLRTLAPLESAAIMAAEA